MLAKEWLKKTWVTESPGTPVTAWRYILNHRALSLSGCRGRVNWEVSRRKGERADRQTDRYRDRHRQTDECVGMWVDGRVDG